MIKKTILNEIERLDNSEIRKIMMVYTIIPAIGTFMAYYFIDPKIAQTFNSIPSIIAGVFALYAFFMLIVFSLSLLSLVVLALRPTIMEKVIQLTSRLLSHVLAHDKEIRKQVVQGIVSDLSDEMKKNPDSEKIAKMEEDLQTALDGISKIQEELKKIKGD